MFTKALITKEVIDVDGNTVGKTRDIDIDMHYGVVNYIIVSGGIGRKYAVKVGNIATIGERIILNCKKDELSRLKYS